MKELLEEAYNIPHCEICNQSKIACLFTKKEHLFSSTNINKIRTFFADEKFKKTVYRAYLENVQTEESSLKKQIDDSIKNGRNHSIELYKLERCKNDYNIKNFEELINSYKESITDDALQYFRSMGSAHLEKDSDNYLKQNYDYYQIICILYENHINKTSRIRYLNQDTAKKIKEIYELHDIDLEKTDQQFRKYKLLSKNEHIGMSYDKYAQGLVDDRLRMFFWIHVPEHLAKAIDQLDKMGVIGGLAFNITSITNGRPSMEEKAYGSVLDLDISEIPDVSEFYSTTDYENKLTVIHDKKSSSLIFEELIGKYELVEEFIVTQLVHLEYDTDNGNYILTHIDHEQIIYTLEQYEQRADHSNLEVRGRKIKSFKIDKAKIPFDYRVGNDLFLAIVLDSYFTNKDLIEEYFAKVNMKHRSEAESN